MKDKSHIITIFTLVIIFVIVGFVVDWLLHPDSFDKYGHYRWNAVNEILSQKILNQNIKTCAKCHDNIYQLHQKDAHYNVPCVDCHGAGNLHVTYHQGGKDSAKITKAQAVLEKKYTLEGCLFCHRKLKAKPTDFPQINQEEHYKFLNVKSLDTKCIECHSPHEPIFLLTDVKQSRLHPIVYKCTDCHDKKPDKDFNEVPEHPKIFECKDCHSDIVKSFEERPHHNYVECRTCHLFHKENETVGRMYKNGNAKFCLLCHEKKDFKNDKYPPKIEWPSHLGNLKFLVNVDQRICLDCHSNQIHKMNLKTNSNPHPNNWKFEHKKYVNAKSDVKQVYACGFCHTKNDCFSCHQVDLPHSEEFVQGGHKEVVAKKGKQVCAKCHNQDFCSQCH